jgi:WD40 repeat protein
LNLDRSSDRCARAVAFSPDGFLLATAESGGTKGNRVRVFAVRKGDERNAFPSGAAPPATSVAFAPDGKLLATAGREKTIRLWSLEHNRQESELRGQRGRRGDFA